MEINEDLLKSVSFLVIRVLHGFLVGNFRPLFNEVQEEDEELGGSCEVFFVGAEDALATGEDFLSGVLNWAMSYV